jgi:hypothetical protein
MALNELPLQDQEQLEAMLQHKLHCMPTGHFPSLGLTDALQHTTRTLLPHIPPDISLTWLLRNRACIDECIRAGLHNKSEDVDEKVVRAVWYYRINAVHQF